MKINFVIPTAEGRGIAKQKGDAMLTERRSINRWQIDQNVSIRLGGGGPEPCRVADINFKGMRIALDRPLPDYPALKMEFAFPGALDFEVEASLPWQRVVNGRYAYGVEFKKIKDSDKDRIYQYVCTNFPDQLRSKWWG